MLDSLGFLLEFLGVEGLQRSVEVGLGRLACGGCRGQQHGRAEHGGPEDSVPGQIAAFPIDHCHDARLHYPLSADFMARPADDAAGLCQRGYELGFSQLPQENGSVQSDISLALSGMKSDQASPGTTPSVSQTTSNCPSSWISPIRTGFDRW